MALILLIYGLAFFILGFSLLTYPWRNAWTGTARHFRAMALFGLLHGMAEWADLVLLSTPFAHAAVLRDIRFGLLFGSFGVLAYFGLLVSSEARRRVCDFDLP